LSLVETWRWMRGGVLVALRKVRPYRFFPQTRANIRREIPWFCWILWLGWFAAKPQIPLESAKF